MSAAEPVFDVYLGLGSNLGNRLQHLRSAVRALAAHPATLEILASPVYETKAHTLSPSDAQPPYLNAVLYLSTSLTPEALLETCHALERQAGRDRSRTPRWAARTLDLDVLHIAHTTRDTPLLKLPHPRLAERRFVLQPWSDLTPNLFLPAPYQKTVSELLASCPDPDVPFRTGDDLMQSTPPTLPDDLRYLVIEGVIGAGKTTLARILAEQYDGQLVLEEFEENPFLARFYEDRRRWAFQTQLSFLASRFRQQQTLLKRDLFHQVVVSDYSFDKDRIFAHLNLNGDELHLYETLYNLMQPNTPTPDLVVYLQSNPDRLMQHIRHRGRSYELDMERAYIESLNEAYNYYFFRYTKSPLLIVNTADIDFVKHPADLSALLRQIATNRHPGTTYFNPTPSGTFSP